MRERKKERPAALEEMTPGQIYWKLFTITLTMSASTFGGGFVIVSMLRQQFVEKLGWLSEEEMLDLTAIAQSSPGALGVNAAIVVGYRLRRFWGSAVCALGAVLPPLVIISVLSLFYNQFRDNPIVALALQSMRAGVAAVICGVVLDLAKNVLRTRSALWILLMAGAFAAACFFGVSAIVIIFVCGGIGLARALMGGEGAGK